MRRRTFIEGIAVLTAAWPLAARAQQPAMPVIGYINSRSAQSDEPFVAAFRSGLAEHGLVEGKNVQIEYRWADNDQSRMPSLATDLITRKPAVIVIGGGAVGTLAIKKLTSSIPTLLAPIRCRPIRAYKTFYSRPAILLRRFRVAVFFRRVLSCSRSRTIGCSGAISFHRCHHTPGFASACRSAGKDRRRRGRRWTSFASASRSIARRYRRRPFKPQKSTNARNTRAFADQQFSKWEIRIRVARSRRLAGSR